jgi:hypothetical protein
MNTKYTELNKKPNYEGKWKSTILPTVKGKIFAHIPLQPTELSVVKNVSIQVIIKFDSTSLFKPDKKVLRYNIDCEIDASVTNDNKNNIIIRTSIIEDNCTIEIKINETNDIYVLEGTYKFNSFIDDKGNFTMRKKK